MSAPSVERPRVIRRKIIVPDTPAGAVPRERLDGLLCQLVDAHRVVAVTATAGAGKSVAVAHASRRFNRPVAWLSVDATDAAPGRLVTYLEEALAQQLPSVRGIATGALAAGVPMPRRRACSSTRPPTPRSCLFLMIWSGCTDRRRGGR